MGNGNSTGQGSYTTYGKRDEDEQSAQISNWPELAGAKLAESSGIGQNPHSGASNVGPSSSRVGATSSEEEDGGIRAKTIVFVEEEQHWMNHRFQEVCYWILARGS